jgi:CheY-like chemotaxis protein
MTDSSFRIVVVEDNPADIFLLRSALAAHSGIYEIEVLTDGEQALRFVRDYRQSPGQSTPCVFVIDWYLPKYDGSEILKAIREESLLSEVPIVILAGLPSKQGEALAKSLGVRVYLNKPADLGGYRKLAEEIAAICEETVLRAAS